MAEFIDFEVSVNEQNQEEKQDGENEISDSDLVSLKSFIGGTEIENDTTFYQQFQNESICIDDILKEESDKSMGDIEKIDLFNFCEVSEKEGEIDQFKETEKRIEKFFQYLQMSMKTIIHLLMPYHLR